MTSTIIKKNKIENFEMQQQQQQQKPGRQRGCEGEVDEDR